ncbi:hypothetical protein BG000_003537 [Podila horticola]|nr:hypothetical protein BG000_003537 [Podila horticola]
MEFTDDVHMETPPVSSANNPDPLLAHNEEEIPSKEKLIRTNLGKTIAQDFGQYRDILDEHPKDYLPQFSSASEALTEFKEKHTTVLKLFHRVALDLQGSNYYRYQRSVSGPMQEYIEAMTLEYHMIHGRLMPKSALEKDLVFMTSSKMMANPDLIISLGQVQSGGRGGAGGGGGGFKGKFGKDSRKGPYNKDKRGGPPKQQPSLSTGSTPASEAGSPSDGKSVPTQSSETVDLTQKVASSSADNDDPEDSPMAEETMIKLTIEGSEIWSLPTPEERVQQILSFLRDIKSGFDGLSLTKSSPIMKKMAVLRQSLNKIEMALYNVRVRGAEYPPEMMRQLLMSTQDTGGGEGGALGGGGGDEDDA